jgi:hypothetical protein
LPLDASKSSIDDSINVYRAVWTSLDDRGRQFEFHSLRHLHRVGSYNHFFVPPPIENVLAGSAGLTQFVSEIASPVTIVRAKAPRRGPTCVHATGRKVP